ARKKAPPEGQILEEVTPREPSRLLDEAMQPFQPHALHPAWSLSHVTAEEAEADADPEPPPPGETRTQGVNQSLLLGGAQGHVHYVSAAGGKVRRQGTQLVRGTLPVDFRAKRARDPEPGI